MIQDSDSRMNATCMKSQRPDIVSKDYMYCLDGEDVAPERKFCKTLEGRGILWQFRAGQLNWHLEGGVFVSCLLLGCAQSRLLLFVLWIGPRVTPPLGQQPSPFLFDETEWFWWKVWRWGLVEGGGWCRVGWR